MTGERVSLSEAAYRHLRGEILACRLAPGQRLTERRLAVDTGHGISPLREALTRLDQEGLIRTLPRKGYQVTPLTLKSIDDLFGMWLIVGPELVRLGVARASEEDLARARAEFAALEAAGTDSAPHFIELAERTFRTLACATGNDYLLGIFDRIAGDMARVWVLILDADPSAPVSGSRIRIGELLDRRDADRAAANARAYIEEAHERVLRAVIRWPSVMKTELVALGH